MNLTNDIQIFWQLKTWSPGQTNIILSFKKTDVSKTKHFFSMIPMQKSSWHWLYIPKLMKMLSDTIAEPLTAAINNCLNHSVFPKNAKIASITSPDK